MTRQLVQVLGVISARQQRDKVASANVKATESNLRVNEANIQRLETLQSFQKVTAPFSGIITARNVDPGALVSADSPSSSTRSTSSRSPRAARAGPPTGALWFQGHTS